MIVWSYRLIPIQILLNASSEFEMEESWMKMRNVLPSPFFTMATQWANKMEAFKIERVRGYRVVVRGSSTSITSGTEGGQLDFCFDLIFASKKDRTANKKVA